MSVAVEYARVEDQETRVIRFFEKHVHHVKGAEWYGKPFKLLEWQVEEIIRPLFGQRIVEPDLPEMQWRRRYRKVYVEVPKKQGKSAFCSGLGLFFLTADGEPGAEVYSVAGDTSQARIVFGDAKKMVEMSPALSRMVRPYRDSLIYEAMGSSWRVLSAEAGTKHGFSPHAILFDELHVQRDRELWDTLVQGVAARTQPVVFAITTAGVWDPDSICWEQHEYAEKVRDGAIEDPTFLPVLYGASPDDDWTDAEVWKKNNPSFGVTVKAEFFEREVREAKEVPAKQNTFRRLHLNVWTEQVTRWIDMETWAANAGEVNEAALLGEPAWGGLDLSSTSDLSAFVLVFKDGDCRKVLPWFFIPAENVAARSKRDAVPYDAWIRDGWMSATPGNTVDYRYIQRTILEVAEKFDLRLLAVDRWNSSQLVTELQGELGNRVVQFGQGYQSMATPTSDLNRLLLDRRLEHGGHPVLRSNAAHVMVRTDPSGNMKPDKSKSNGRIDGITALIMALGVAEPDVETVGPSIFAVGS